MNQNYAEFCQEMQEFAEFVETPYAQNFLHQYPPFRDAGSELTQAQLWHCCQELDSGPTFRNREAWQRYHRYHHPADPAGYDDTFLQGHFDQNDMWVAD